MSLIFTCLNEKIKKSDLISISLIVSRDIISSPKNYLFISLPMFLLGCPFVSDLGV